LNVAAWTTPTRAGLVKPSRPNPYAATLVRKRPSLDFSVSGLVYSSMMMFMGLAALNSQANLLFGVFGLMIGVLMFSLMFSKLVVRRLSVRRTLPDQAFVGRPCAITYEITNTKRFWPSMSVTLSEIDGVDAFVRQPHAYMLHAAPGMTATVPAEVLPRRRGAFRLGQFQLSTSFPFGFVKRAIDQRQPDTLLVFPALGEVNPRLLHLFRSAESSGMMMRPRAGGDDEFYGLKEYRSGESPKRIYWRRSARTGTLLVREMTHISPPRVLLLVDTYVAEQSSERLTAIERAVAMAASIGSRALDEGLPVGLFAFNRDGFVNIPANRGKRHRRDLLTALARLPVNRECDASQLMSAARSALDSRTTVVLLTPDETVSMPNDSARLALMTLSGHPRYDGQWVKFPTGLDFAQALPLDANVLISSSTRDRG
jgi:uncharacterized protein (DUF58 family)